VNCAVYRNEAPPGIAGRWFTETSIPKVSARGASVGAGSFLREKYSMRASQLVLCHRRDYLESTEVVGMFEHVGMKPLWPVIFFLPWVSLGFAYLLASVRQWRSWSLRSRADKARNDRTHEPVGSARHGYRHT
jgi:hypothetical protein